MNKLKYLVALFLVLMFVGCGSNALEGLADDDSSEATKAKIEEALNDGDYDEVIDELGDDDDLDELARRWLASAYLGKSGVDFINTLEAVGDGDAEAFDVLAGTLGDDFFDNESIAQRRAWIQLAFDVLAQNRRTAVRAPAPELPIDCDGTDDELFLDGVGGAVDTILFVGELLLGTFGDAIVAYNEAQSLTCGGDDVVCVYLNEEWIAGVVDEFGPDAVDNLTSNITSNDIDDLNDNMQKIECGIAVLTGDTFDDIKDDFEMFRNEICGDDNVCTEAEISNYITSLGSVN